MRVGSRERVRGARGIHGMRRLAGGDVETEEHGPTCNSRGREEMTDRAVQGMDARAALGGMGLDVRRGVRARRVEPGVGPRGGSRQQQLQQGSQEP